MKLDLKKRLEYERLAKEELEAFSKEKKEQTEHVRLKKDKFIKWTTLYYVALRCFHAAIFASIALNNTYNIYKSSYTHLINYNRF